MDDVVIIFLCCCCCLHHHTVTARNRCSDSSSARQEEENFIQDGEDSTLELFRTEKPLFFSLLRGIGSQKGDIETSYLLIVPLNGGDIILAPGFETAYEDGGAMGVEVINEGSKLGVIRAGQQYTLSHTGEIAEAVEMNAYLKIKEQVLALSKLYIRAQRLNSFLSNLFLIGVVLQSSDWHVMESAQLVFHNTVFAKVNDRITLGLEVNAFYDFAMNQSLFLGIYPIVQIRPVPSVVVLIGIGLAYSNGVMVPQFVNRVFVESVIE